MGTNSSLTSLNVCLAVFFLFFAVTALVSFTLRQTQIRMLHFTGPCIVCLTRGCPLLRTPRDPCSTHLSMLILLCWACAGQLRQYIRSGLPFGRLVVLHVLVRSIINEARVLRF
jgi:hypothetical protein